MIICRYKVDVLWFSQSYLTRKYPISITLDFFYTFLYTIFFKLNNVESTC